MDKERAFRRYLQLPGRRRLARVVEAHYAFVWQTAMRVTAEATLRLVPSRE